MMRLNYAFCMFLLFSMSLYAYQDNFLNLVTPSQLSDWDAEATFSHRFYGNVDKKPLDTFFGMDAGANTGLFFRKNITHGAEVMVGYTRAKNEYTMDATYRFTPLAFPVQGQADIQYFTFKELDQTDRRNNLLYLIALQNKPLKDIIIMNLNIGYDGYYKRMVNGFGLGIKPGEKISLIGEYYPVWDRKSASDRLKKYLGAHDAFAIGLKYNTYGHQFTLMLGNSEQMSPRELSLGTLKSSDLKFGFNIQRRFEHWGK